MNQRLKQIDELVSEIYGTKRGVFFLRKNGQRRKFSGWNVKKSYLFDRNKAEIRNLWCLKICAGDEIQVSYLSTGANGLTMPTGDTDL